jgi:hypothetical protein
MIPATADSVHKVFSSTFETIPNRRGEHPFRIARMSAIDAGIPAIRAGGHSESWVFSQTDAAAATRCSFRFGLRFKAAPTNPLIQTMMRHRLE